jgi:hypothetical protein
MILSYRRDKDEPLTYTDRMLKESLPCDRALMACGRLIGLGELARHNGGYLVTLEGEQRYQDAMDNPIIPTSVQEWKTEALTGIRLNGDPTDILNPVIPGAETRPFNETPEDMVMTAEQFKAAMTTIAKDLGLNVDKLLKFHAEGRLRKCTKGGDHLGIFDKNGYGWQAYCRKCSKKFRQARRKKQ